MAKQKNAPTKGGKKGKKKFSIVAPFKKMGHFFKEVISELKKVTWPTKKVLISYTIAVVVFVVIAMVVIFLLDTGATKGIELILGAR